MKRLSKFTLVLVAVGLLFFGKTAQGQEQPEIKSEYYKARVMEVLSSQENEDPNDPFYDRTVQSVRVLIISGPEKGVGKDVSYYPKSAAAELRLQKGEVVYLTKVDDGDNIYYTVSERYRLNVLWWLAAFFVLLVVVVGRYKGFGSLLGLGFSFLVIAKFIVPQILAGKDPVVICLIGSVAIAVVSIYIAHGFRLRTSLAVISTIATIAIALGLDYLIIHWLRLFGAGSEEAVYAQFLQTGAINLRGLLLGGIIIGVLGVLDDITTAQSAVVDELRRANPAYSFRELYQRGMSVGKEHIASLINTLVLAYVGASFPLVLLFQQLEQPFAYIINSELVAEEIARTLIGSAALIIAVPLTTALTAYVMKKRPLSDLGKPAEHSHSHGH